MAEQVHDTRNSRETAHGTPEASEETVDFDDEKLLDGISQPVVMVGGDDAVLAWNASMETLTGVAREQVSDVADARQALYGAGTDAPLVAERVLEAPRSAHDRFDLERVDRELDIYRTTVRFESPTGEQLYYEVSARPLTQRGDDVQAVIQTVQNRTAERRHRRAISNLVSELSTTIDALERGHLDARASFTDPDDALEEETLAVVEQLNDMAAAFERLTERVQTQTAAFQATVDEAARAARRIDERVDEQADVLASVTEETTTFSATMQEVAASADEVATAATEARDAAERGSEASEDAEAAVEAVTSTSEELVATVDALTERMDTIEDVVEVIDDVADQTNILALNASIEAARAGDDGDGFGVVADEIKGLADETSSHADDVITHVADLQAQTDEVVETAERSNEQLHAASDDIDEALAALADISASVDEAATGITQIADVIDDQTESIEQVQSLVARADDHIDEVSAATTDIVAVTERQEDAIADLSHRVDALTGADGRETGD